MIGQEKVPVKQTPAQQALKLTALMQSVVPDDRRRYVPKLRPASSSAGTSTEEIKTALDESYEREVLEADIHETFARLHQATTAASS